MEDDYRPVAVDNIRDILTVLFKHKIKIVVTFLVIAIGVILFAMLLPKTYEAKSVLLVKFGREFMSRPEAGGERAGFAVPPQQIISGELSILTSRDLLTRVVQDVGPDALYPGLANMPGQGISSIDAATQTFEESIVARNIPGSSLIEVSFSHPNPEVAAKSVNLLVDLFKEKHLEVFSSDSTPFLKNQQKIFRERLKESEDKLATFKQRNRMASLEEQRAALIGQRNALDASLKGVQVQVVEMEQKISLIKNRGRSVETPAELRAQLVGLQQKERELLEKYTESSRAVQSVRQEMQSIKETIKRSSEEIRQAELGKLEGEFSVLNAKADSLRRQLNQTDGELYSLEARGPQLQDLRRDLAQQEQNFQTYSKKLEESLIMDDMDRQKMVGISVVEKASVSGIPKKGRFEKKQLALMGLFAGIAVSIGLAFLIEFLSPGMTTVMSAERRLGIPVMVAISKRG